MGMGLSMVFRSVLRGSAAKADRLDGTTGMVAGLYVACSASLERSI